MNLTSKKARVSIGSVGVAALVVGGGWMAASSAFADPAPLTLTPGTTSIGITDLDPSANTPENAEVGYALKVGAAAADPLRLAVISGPASGGIGFELTSGVTPPTGTVTATVATPASPATESSAEVNATPAAADRVYLSSLVPGTYTLKLYSDTSNNNVYDSTLDPATPLITVTVYDVTGATPVTTDDLPLTLTAPATVDQQGRTVKVAASASVLTKTDIRGLAGGSTPGGQLGKEYQDVAQVEFSGGPADAAAAPTVFNGTDWTLTSGAASAGTMTSTATIGTLTKTATTTIADNTVSTLTWTNKDTVNIDYPTTDGDAAVRSNTGPQTFTVKAEDSANHPVSGANVWFNIDADVGMTIADVSVSPGTLVTLNSSEGEVAVTTDSNGVATLTVTTAAAANDDGDHYHVYPVSNAVNPGGDIRAIFEDTAPISIESVGNVSGKVGTSVTISGKVLDRWKQLYTPSMPGTQATLAVTRNFSGGPRTVSAANYSDTVNITGGLFTASVADSAGNTAPVVDTYTWTVGSLPVTAAKNINWRASITPATITVTSLDGQPVPIASTYKATLATHTVTNSVPIVGVIKDEGGQPLPYATYKIAGSDGVMFLDKDGNAQSSLDVRTGANGEITADESATPLGVFFTKTGAATITVTSGAAPAQTISFKVDDPVVTEDYKVEVFDTQGDPGDNVTVTGQVTDAFGNGVPNAPYELAVPDAEFGAITTGASGTTNSFGKFTAIYTSGGTDSGIITTRARINGYDGTNPAAPAASTLAGMAIPAGVQQATGKITVKTSAVTLSVEPSRISAGPVNFTGTASPNATIDIYGKRTGTTAPYAVLKTVTANAAGEFSGSVKIVRSITFYAQMGTVKSEQMTTTVFSKVTISAEALGGGKIQLKADGNPNQATKLSFYWLGKGGLHKIDTLDTNSKGFASMVWSTTKGTKVIRAYYVATGTRTGFAQSTVVND